MLPTQFGGYTRRLARHCSSAYALIAAILIDAVLVVSLLHLAFRFQLAEPDSHVAPRIVPEERVTYVALSSTNKTPAPTKVMVNAAGGALEITTLSHSRGLRVVESPAASIDTALPSFESSRQRSGRVFPAITPRTDERSRTQVIDSIIRTDIQPGNDSAARMRLARRSAVDWTVNLRGERYGVSPGEVHLGKISIRAPIVFAEPLSFDSDRRRSVRAVIEDTRLHGAQAARDAAFDSAVASIRLRRLVEGSSRNDSISSSQHNQRH